MVTGLREASPDGYRLPRRMGLPKSSFGRSGAPHSSHSTWNADGSRASQAGQRETSGVSHCGHTVGRSASCFSK